MSYTITKEAHTLDEHSVRLIRQALERDYMRLVRESRTMEDVDRANTAYKPVLQVLRMPSIAPNGEPLGTRVTVEKDVIGS